MDTIFGMEFPLLVKFVISFAIVLALIGAAAFLVRRFGAKGLVRTTTRNRQPRLAVVDTAPIDSRRSLVIVRRDNVEHLLLIGGPTDLLVEPNISPAAAHMTRDPEPLARPAIAEPPAPPNWAPATAIWPVARPAEAPRPEVVQKPEPRLDVRPEPVVRTEPAFLPEPAQRPDPEVRIQPVPAFEPAPSSAAVRSTPAQNAYTISPHDNPLPAFTVPQPARPAMPPIETEELPVPAVAQDLDAPREKMSGTTAAHQNQPNSTQPKQTATAAPIPVRPAEPAFNEDQNLADMAQRLEAALRRPLGANGTRAAAPPQAALRPAAAQMRQTNEFPRATPVANAPAIPAAAPPVVTAPTPAARSEAETYENLQREMASLLGRKPGSS
jgi:flagellar protein FliO/FliZ